MQLPGSNADLPSRVLAASCLVGAVLLAGCEPSPTSKRGPATPNAQGGLFDSVAENLEHMEQFEPTQINKQICERLNQWYLQEKPQVKWQEDPLVAGLSDESRRLPAMKTLDANQFRLADARFLQEQVWLRDISKRVRADQFTDLGVAEKLFDWTVRNVQLDSAPASASLGNWHRPFETLLLGRGTVEERAWVFMLLARQQGLDVVLLAIPGEGGSLRTWLPALMSEGQMYLFDCVLGLPIPGPEGRGVATLEQVAADDGLLRRLDLDAEHPYPVRAEQLKGLVAYVEASPYSLSKRIALVESKLSGKHKMLLAVQPSGLAERLKAAAPVAEVKIWPWPFEVYRTQSTMNEQTTQEAGRELMAFQIMPELFKARSLYFRGDFDGDAGTKKYYLDARPPEEFLKSYQLPPETAQKFKREDLSKIEAMQVVFIKQAKQNASYWLGLLLFEEQDYPSAIDFFQVRTLEMSPDGPWTDGAHYNLARCYEATGESDKAIAEYETASKNLQTPGNRLRARWLREKGEGK